MAISNELLSTTLYSIRDKEVDELFRKVAFLENCKAYNGIEFENGGIKIQRPLALAEHSVITQLTTGYEPVSLAVQDVLQPAIYNWCDFTAPIVISEKEELENSGEKAIVKIVEVRMRSVMGMLKRELNKQILLGTSTILTEMNTLNGDKGGFLEAEAVGAQTNSVGGIGKGVVNAVGWQNQLANAGGAFGTNGIRVMQQAQIEADSIAPMGTMDAVILSNACMANYRAALEVNVRYINAEQLNAGKMNLAFGDATVESDSVLNYTLAAGTYAGKKISGYMINFEAIKMVFHSKGDFAVRPFEYIPGTATRSSRLYVKCQLIADHLGSNGIIIDGEVF